MTPEERIARLFGPREPQPAPAAAKPAPHATRTSQRAPIEWAQDAPAKTTAGLPTPSTQQEAILNSELKLGESLKVEAAAGSGKTTSMLLFSRRHRDKKILYICFSNKGSQEAREKYQAAGIRNTTVSTVHGLASSVKRRFELGLDGAMKKFQTKVTTKDIQKNNPSMSYRRAWEVLETIKTFCESADTQPGPQHTPNIPGLMEMDRRAIASKAAQVWAEMRDPKQPAPVSYDHYLKIYELENPVLNYDYILLDEAQDSNPLTLQLLRKQQHRTRILLIGDSHQAIYKWRGAKDAMQDWETPHTLPLSESFRFGKKIAAAANIILKTFYGPRENIHGKKPTDTLGRVPLNQQYTLIARTNATLFEEALDQLSKKKKYHFVGTTRDANWDPSVPYRFHDALDVYSLFCGKKQGIRNMHISAFSNYNELKQAAEGIDGRGDKELESLCKIVEKHKHKLPQLLETIVKNCTSPEQADIQLVTCHRSKGLEWNNVKIASDFTKLIEKVKGSDETRLARIGNLEFEKDLDADFEEINLRYVAITRGKEIVELDPDCQEFFSRIDLLPDYVLNDPDYKTQLAPKSTPTKQPTQQTWMEM